MFFLGFKQKVNALVFFHDISCLFTISIDGDILDGDITLLLSLDPRFDLQLKANSYTFPVETETSSLQSIPAFRKLVTCRIDVVLQRYD